MKTGVLWVKRTSVFQNNEDVSKDAVWLMGWREGFYAWMIVIHNYTFFFLPSKTYNEHHIN